MFYSGIVNEIVTLLFEQRARGWYGEVAHFPPLKALHFIHSIHFHLQFTVHPFCSLISSVSGSSTTAMSRLFLRKLVPLPLRYIVKWSGSSKDSISLSEKELRPASMNQRVPLFNISQWYALCGNNYSSLYHKLCSKSQVLNNYNKVGLSVRFSLNILRIKIHVEVIVLII